MEPWIFPFLICVKSTFGRCFKTTTKSRFFRPKNHEKGDVKNNDQTSNLLSFFFFFFFFSPFHISFFFHFICNENNFQEEHASRRIGTPKLEDRKDEKKRGEKKKRGLVDVLKRRLFRDFQSRKN